MFYINIENGKINGGSELNNSRFWTEDYFQVEVSEEIYNAVTMEPEKYIYSNGDIVENPDYETEQAEKERERLNLLSLTKREVFLALYKAKGLTPDQLKAQIADPEALIEFEFANDYYRGNPLINQIGAMLGYSGDDLDYLFQNKELPSAAESEE